jgi:uncharacterized protein YndB with AHSA1/START domain
MVPGGQNGDVQDVRFLFLLLPATASAAVADSAANGFTVKLNFAIAATPIDVYRKLIHNVGDWWNPAHTFSQNAHNLSFEEKPMGCFCEKPGDGAMRHLEILRYVPGKILVLSGGLGPLQALATTGTMTIEFQPGESTGTNLDVTYTVGGYLAKGLNTWAAPVDGMLTEQFTRLKSFVEKGKP